MKSRKKAKLINEIRYLRGPEPTVAESGAAVSFQLIQALKTGKTVLVPRPRLNRTHQLHLLNGRVVYGTIRPHKQEPLTITIDEFTDELTVEKLMEGIGAAAEQLRAITPTAAQAAEGFQQFAEALQEETSESA